MEAVRLHTEACDLIAREIQPCQVLALGEVKVELGDFIGGKVDNFELCKGFEGS